MIDCLHYPNHIHLHVYWGICSTHYTTHLSLSSPFKRIQQDVMMQNLVSMIIIITPSLVCMYVVSCVINRVVVQFRLITCCKGQEDHATIH